MLSGKFSFNTFSSAYWSMHSVVVRSSKNISAFLINFTELFLLSSTPASPRRKGKKRDANFCGELFLSLLLVHEIALHTHLHIPQTFRSITLHTLTRGDSQHFQFCYYDYKLSAAYVCACWILREIIKKFFLRLLRECLDITWWDEVNLF